LEEVSQKLIDELQRDGSGEFDFREPIQILEQDSQDASIFGDWFTGGWRGAIRERRLEARLALVMLLITFGLWIATWPRTIPATTTLPQYQSEWIIQQFGRLSTGTLIASVVAFLEIVFHYFDATRHKKLRWRHRQ